MEHFDEAAYKQKLIDAGTPSETAAAVARKYAENGFVIKPKTLDSIEPYPSITQNSAPESSTAASVANNRTRGIKNPKPKHTKTENKIIEKGATISMEPPSGQDMTFLHSIMCQVGLPRAKVDGLEFERICGNAGLHIRAGKLWDGRQFVQQPLPYGPMPRLVMGYLNTYALRHNTPVIEVGHSAVDFLKRLGKTPSGGKNGNYTTFRRQIQALSACTMTLGFTQGEKSFTYDGKPINKFEAWVSNGDEQGTLWPGVITFSHEYFSTLCNHAVPLDVRALGALEGSALAMDIYAMLAERLHRIAGRPLMLHWRNLRDQFGQEYQGKDADKNFKKGFLPALQKALAVYPEAQVKQVSGGILMLPSPPPIPYKG